MDCTAHQSTCGQYHVQGYPTIKVFGSNKESPSDYQGGRDSGSLVSEANKAWASNAKPREVRVSADMVFGIFWVFYACAMYVETQRGGGDSGSLVSEANKAWASNAKPVRCVEGKFAKLHPHQQASERISKQSFTSEHHHGRPSPLFKPSMSCCAVSCRSVS